MGAAGPTMRRHRSKQDYRTPVRFLHAVRKRLETTDFTVDLAATRQNRVCSAFVSPEEDALSFSSWEHLIGPSRHAYGWLNPPFNHIAPWAERCARTARRGGRVALLTPASVGSVWFTKYVAGRALVLLLKGRLEFIPGEPYPKDCMLSLFGEAPGIEIWDWRRDVRIPFSC